MNQNFSIYHLKRKFGRFRLLGGLLFLALGCGALGYWLADKSLATDKVLFDSQQQRLDELYRLSDSQLQQINFLQVEIEVEKQAGVHVQQQLKQLHQENFKLQNQLSFYQKIMAPELKAGGIEIDQFELSPTSASHIFHYKIVLVQTQKRKRYARGFVEFSIEGIEKDKTKRYEAKELIENFDKKSLQFSFQYFQILEGHIVIPNKFDPQTAFVSVILPTGKWQKYERLDRQYPFVQDPVK